MEKTKQPEAVRADRKSQNHHELGKEAPRFVVGIYSRLSLDDSGDRWAQEILEISEKGENIAKSRWQRFTVGIDSR